MMITQLNPPSAIEHEMGLIASILVHPLSLGDAIRALDGPSDFYSPANAKIYQVLLDLYDGSPEFNYFSVIQLLRDKGILDGVGGDEYLRSMVEGYSNLIPVEEYAKVVAEKARIRRLILACESIAYKGYRSTDTFDIQIDSADQSLFALRSSSASAGYTSAKEVADRVVERVCGENKKPRGLPISYHYLRSMIGGLRPTEMIVIGARPSIGKTAFALNMIDNLVGANDIPVGMFSVEMASEQLIERMACMRTGVDSIRLAEGKLNKEEQELVRQACGEIRQLPFYINDQSSISLRTLYAEARRMVRERGVKAIFVDYLQLMTCADTENRLQEVSQISRGLKGLAKELKAPVIALTQLNRNVEGRADFRPRLSDIRESGAIEQDADIVLMIHREDYYRDKDPSYQSTHKAEIQIEKNRNGPTGIVDLHFNKSCGKFSEWGHSTVFNGRI